MKKVIILFAVTLILFSCFENGGEQQDTQTIAEAPIECAFTIGDQTKLPDLTVTAFLGNNKERFALYGLNPALPSVSENGLVGSYAAIAYDWIYQDTFSAIKTWCIFENIAACHEDFWFLESQGTQVKNVFGTTYTIYDGLLKTDVFYHGELVNTQQKRTFEPSEVPDTTLGCEQIFYNTFNVIHSHNADLYINPNRIPRNTDGLFVIRLEVNPLVNGCHAIRELNYDNNKFFATVSKVGTSVTFDATAIADNVPATPTNGLAKLQPAVKGKKSVIITWTSKAERFDVFKNGVLIGDNIYSKTFTDTKITGNVNNIKYTIVAENEDIGISVATDPISITKQ